MGLSSEIMAYLSRFLSELGLSASAIRSVLVAVSIFVFFLALALFLGRYVRIRASVRFSREAALILGRVTSALIVFAGFALALHSLGFNISSLLLAGGFLAVALGFAAQTVVSNLLSGVFLYVDRPFTIGDPVMIGNNTGIVEDVTIFSTRLRTFDGRLLRISNNEVFNSTIVNMMATKARRIEYRFLLPHNSDAKKAISIVKDILEKHPLILADPGPQVFINESNLDGIIMTIWAWSPSKSFFPVWTELFSTIREELIKAGIQLAVPQRIITIRGPESAGAPGPEEETLKTREKQGVHS